MLKLLRVSVREKCQQGREFHKEMSLNIPVVLTVLCSATSFLICSPTKPLGFGPLSPPVPWMPPPFRTTDGSKQGMLNNSNNFRTKTISGRATESPFLVDVVMVVDRGWLKLCLCWCVGLMDLSSRVPCSFPECKQNMSRSTESKQIEYFRLREFFKNFCFHTHKML